MTSVALESCTDVKSVHLTYEWTIKNFKLLYHQNGEYLYSPVFGVENDNIQWKLKLYPRGDNNNRLEFACIFLSLANLDIDTSNIKVTGRLSIVKSNIKLVEVKIEDNFDQSYASLRKAIAVIERQKLLDECQFDDCFIIRWECDQTFTFSEKPIKHVIVFNSEFHKLGEDCRSLLQQSNQFSDVTIVVGDKSIPAHRCLLAARSPVFAGMFTNKKMEENGTNGIKIEDFDTEVVEAVLEFIYTDQVTDLPQLAGKLIAAAQTYELERLKAMCEEALYESLDIKNACDILVLADLYGSHKLTENVIKFISDHYNEVIKTKAYARIKDPKLFILLTRSATLRDE